MSSPARRRNQTSTGFNISILEQGREVESDKPARSSSKRSRSRSRSRGKGRRTTSQQNKKRGAPGQPNADFFTIEPQQEFSFFSFFNLRGGNKQNQLPAVRESYIPKNSHFTKNAFIDFIKRGYSLFKSYNSHSPYINNKHAATTRIDLISIKEKKQMHLDLHYFSKSYQNREFIFCDDGMRIVDFSAGEISLCQELYRVWDPKGQPFWLGYCRGLALLAFVDYNGLNFVEAYITDLDAEEDHEVRFRRYVVDSKVRGNFEFDSTVTSQKKKLGYYLRKMIGKDGYGYGELKQIRRVRIPRKKADKNLEGGRSKGGLEDVDFRFGVKKGWLRIGKFSRKNLSLMRFIFHQKQNLLILITERGIGGANQTNLNARTADMTTRGKSGRSSRKARKPKQKFIVVHIYKAGTKKLIRTFKIRISIFESISLIKVKKSKLMLRANNKIFLINFVKLLVYQVKVKPTDRVMFTKKKDYLSGNSRRLKFFKGITIVDTNFKGMTGAECYDIARLKKGDILVKLDYNILRLYYNITQKRLELVVRLDLPSEITPFYNGFNLYETPNINQLRRFYLKIFDMKSHKMDITLHRSFKKLTSPFQKRFKNIQRLEYTSRIYLEATRLNDHSASKYKKTRSLMKTFKPLYCIEYDFVRKKVLFFKLPSLAKNSLFPLGEDLGWRLPELARMREEGVEGKNVDRTIAKKRHLREEGYGVVYVLDSQRRLIRLIRHLEEAEEVKLDWIDQIVEGEGDGKEEPNPAENQPLRSTTASGEASLRAEDRDNFGNFKKTGLDSKYFFYAGRAYFCNSVSLVCLDLYKKRRRVLIEKLEHPKNLILHFDNSKKQLIIFDNSLKIYTLRFNPDGSEQDLITHTLPNTLIRKRANLLDLKLHHVNTSRNQFCVVYGHKVSIFHFTELESAENREKMEISEVELAVNSNIYQNPTIRTKEGRFYKIISGETILNLETFEYSSWKISKQFHHFKLFIGKFTKISEEGQLVFSEKKVLDYDRNRMFHFLDKFFYDSLKYKQIGFQFFELGLNFSYNLVLYGDSQRLEAYLDCVNWFDGYGYKGVLQIDEVKAQSLLGEIDEIEREEGDGEGRRRDGTAGGKRGFFLRLFRRKEGDGDEFEFEGEEEDGDGFAKRGDGLGEGRGEFYQKFVNFCGDFWRFFLVFTFFGI